MMMLTAFHDDADGRSHYYYFHRIHRPQSESGRQFGWETFVTMTWGLVMWHWKHQVPLAKGEMPGAMARSMDYIYADGDVPGIKKWFTPSSYAAMVLALWQFLRTSGRI